MQPTPPTPADPDKVQLGSRVRIFDGSQHDGRTGVVIEAERDREVANVLVDESDTTTEVDYYALELWD